MTKSSCPVPGRRRKHLIMHDKKDEIADVVPDEDPRSLHTLVMSLSEEKFQTVTHLLSLTPNLTPNEVRNFLLKEGREKAAVRKGPNAPTEESGTQGQGDKLAGRREREKKFCNNCKKYSHGEDRCWLLHPELSRKPRCGACGKVGHGEDGCWTLCPELAPTWYQKQLKKENIEGMLFVEDGW